MGGREGCFALHKPCMGLQHACKAKETCSTAAPHLLIMLDTAELQQALKQANLFYCDYVESWAMGLGEL